MLPATGTYTVLVRDCSDLNTGNYTIYTQRTNNPSGASNLPFGQTETGLIGSAAQSNSYAFNGNANDRIDFTYSTTNGVLIPKIILYNPDGTLNSSNYANSPFGCAGSVVELNTVQLKMSGTQTVLVRDCPDTNSGNYAIYAQRTNNPSGAFPFVWGGQTQPFMIGSPAQSVAYTFTATPPATILNLTLSDTAPIGSLVPKILVYNPDGTLNASNYANSPFGCAGTTVALSSVSLTQPAPPGNYTILVRDCSDKGTGNFNLSGQCIGCNAAPPPPTLTSITPTSGVRGTAVNVTLTGTNFTDYGGASIWGIPGVRITNFAVLSPTEITATFNIVSNASLYPSNVRNIAVLTPGGGNTSFTSGFQHFTLVGPVLLSVTPTTGSRGNIVPVTLTGTGLTGTTSIGVTALGSAIGVSNVTVVNDSMVTATFSIPGNTTLGARTLSVIGPVGGPSTNTNPIFTVVNPPAPTLTSVTPNSSADSANVPVTLIGANFTPIGTTVAVSGAGFSVSKVVVVNSTTITATIALSSSASGSSNVTVTTPGGTSNAVQFTSTAPTLTSISPASGLRGTAVNVTLTGTNFTSTGTSIWSGGLLGITVSNFTVVNSTTITATFNIPITTSISARNIAVLTPGGGNTSFTSGFQHFTVLGPVLTSISPPSGTRGTTVPVTLTGSGLTGTTAINVSGTGVTITGLTVMNDTTVTANFVIASGAATGARTISVSAPGGTSNNSPPPSFTVN